MLLQSQFESQQLFTHELLLCTMGIKDKMKAAFILTGKSFRKVPVYYSHLSVMLSLSSTFIEEL